MKWHLMLEIFTFWSGMIYSTQTPGLCPLEEEIKIDKEIQFKNIKRKYIQALNYLGKVSGKETVLIQKESYKS